MYSKLVVFIMLVSCSIGSLANSGGIQFDFQDAKKPSCNYKILKEHNLLDYNHNTIVNGR